MQIVVEPDKNMTSWTVDEEDGTLTILPRHAIKSRKYSPALHLEVRSDGATIGRLQLEVSQTGEVKKCVLEEVENDVDPEEPGRTEVKGTGELGEEEVSLDDR